MWGFSKIRGTFNGLWGYPKIRGTFNGLFRGSIGLYSFGGPQNKDYSVLGLVLEASISFDVRQKSHCH